MFQARRSDTSEIIESEELKVISNVTDIDFVCVDPQCGLELIPCSFGKDNKKRPYFKKHKGIEHSSRCDYSSYLNYLEVGKKRALTKEELVKMDYPSQLVSLKPKEQLSTDTATVEDIPVKKSTSVRRVDSGEYSEAVNSSRKVTSINRIVDFFLECYYNRGVDLNLLGRVAPYRYQFKQIRGKNEGNYIDNKIFYGRINFSEPDSVFERGGKTYIRMHEFEGKEKILRSIRKKERYINPYYVEIDNSAISKYKLSSILKSRETVSNESKNRFFSNRKKEKEEAYIFFLGLAPDRNNPYTFKAVGGFVAFRYTKVIHPKDTRQA